MLDPKNTVNLSGGLVADPERPTDNIVKMRLALDYAGAEKGSDNKSGYFDVVYYLNNDGNSTNANWLKSQIEAGKMGKGSSIQLMGRLVQERWKAEDGKSQQRVVIVAESLTYAGSKNPDNAKTASVSAGTSAELPSQW